MIAFEPLLLLAAIFALVAGSAWFRVGILVNKHSIEFARSSRALSLAASGTGITLMLAGASILLPSVALLFV